MIFAHHPWQRETEGGRFHDVDDEGDDEDAHKTPVRRAERRILGWRDDDVLAGGELPRNLAGKQSVGRDCATADDRNHAEDHVQADRHAGEHEMIVPAHQEHRRVQQDAAGDQDHAEHEGP